MPGPFSTPVAKSTPFDNTTNGFTATEAQTAIEEAKSTAPGIASRFVVTAGFAGTAGNNTYLQWFRSNPSNTTPFVIAEDCAVRSLSIASSSSATCTISLLKNGASVGSISLAAATSNQDATTNISLVAGDKLSVRVTSGSVANPGFYVGIQTGG